ncbi:c-type cytochrome [Pedobacter puniceum]|jgi:mono/diheme cytochrome c family protein|uniref:C-type cytochrome n=1 Tax=Pedobacter puniceum TaxID=2666136 RepID=A0A7K0FR35_9SPHI|nr:cytochrome c [Pedobacter puniceum]MRX48444.1 c-type cytochrome [Pedobacter puniceum]
MKNLTKVSIALWMVIVTFIYACGGSDKPTSTQEQAEAPAEQATVTDTKAKSNSKGVGRFTSVEIGPIDHDLAAKGEAVFTSKCAACHKTTADKVVGPGLKNITNIREPEWIMNMITNPEEMTKKDPVAKALFEEHLVQMTFQNVSDDEARQILEFLRKNDSQ